MEKEILIKKATEELAKAKIDTERDTDNVENEIYSHLDLTSDDDEYLLKATNIERLQYCIELLHREGKFLSENKYEEKPTMKTKLPERIETVAEAESFLSELIKNDEVYHPEDNAHNIH